MTFQILSLSGGGFFGLYTVTVLAELEKQLGRPIAQAFDLLAGTSVGGIIALGLAAEVSVASMKEAFERNGTRIFSDRRVPRTKREVAFDYLRFLCRPKYASSPLRDTIVQILGEDQKIGQLKHPVIIPAVNLTKGSPQLFKTPHHQNFKRDLHLKVVDVALATSAAPTYFPIAQIGDELFADGGLYSNSPDLLALHEALYFFEVPETEIRILSIGTTTAKFSFAHEDGLNFGVLQWAKEQRLVNVIISTQQQIVDYQLQHRLKDRYFRIDEQQSKIQERALALDVATPEAQKTIRGLAMSSVQRVINDERLNKMLNHVAAPPRFYDAI